jgi:hypothetical protein
MTRTRSSESYATSMLRDLLEAGPQPDEDFFRMKAMGNGQTHWFNISPAQLEAIAALLDDHETL